MLRARVSTLTTYIPAARQSGKTGCNRFCLSAMWQVDAWRTASGTLNYRGWRFTMVLIKALGYLLLLWFGGMLLLLAMAM